MQQQAHHSIDMEKMGRGTGPAWENRAGRNWGRLYRLLRIGLLCLVLHQLWIRSNTILNHQFKSQKSRRVQLPHEYEGNYQSNALNETLGFQNIFVLNLPKRVDRRDMMTLMAMASDLKIDFFDALDGNQTAQVRLPKIDMIEYLKETSYSFTPGQLGCYRSNLNIMQHIVNNRISSALIIQDDADWDEGIKSSLQKLQGENVTGKDDLQKR